MATCDKHETNFDKIKGMSKMSSVFGIDILQDNCEESRARLRVMYCDKFPNASELALVIVDGVLKNNIICGNSLEIMKEWEIKDEKS